MTAEIIPVSVVMMSLAIAGPLGVLAFRKATGQNPHRQTMKDAWDRTLLRRDEYLFPRPQNAVVGLLSPNEHTLRKRKAKKKQKEAKQ